MIGVPITEPNTPGLVMVKVPLLHLVRAQLLGPGPLAQVVDGAGQPEQRQLVGVLDDRHDQSPVERHGDAEVDVAPEDGALAATRRS